MNLDKAIKIKLLTLSSKYDISLIEIQKPKENRISRVFNFNYKLIDAPKTDNICKTFYNKKDLVSWLICLE